MATRVTKRPRPVGQEWERRGRGSSSLSVEFGFSKSCLLPGDDTVMTLCPAGVGRHTQEAPTLTHSSRRRDRAGADGKLASEAAGPQPTNPEVQPRPNPRPVSHRSARQTHQRRVRPNPAERTVLLSHPFLRCDAFRKKRWGRKKQIRRKT